MFQRKHISFFTAAGAFLLVALCLQASGQSSTLASIQSSFENHQKERLQEKLFVHTDKSFYLAGELVWFKAYCVNASNNTPLNLSKVAYVELLDGNNKPVMQAKIALSDGVGNGSLLLPGSVGSGNYRFRAYTAWMKNFSADFYFAKDLTIINTRKGGGLPESAEPAHATARFYPEGGHLVAGMQSRVAFRVADPHDRGQQCTGFVVDDRNDTAARFSPLKFGIGRFDFTPQPGRQYKAVVQTADGERITTALPAAREKGYVMRLEETGSGALEAVVQTNVPDAIGTDVYLLVHTRQQIKIAAQSKVRNGNAVFSIDKSVLGEGISHVTVFDNQQRPLCERLYFKSPEERLSIIANSDQSQYGTRKKVTLSVDSRKKEQAVVANMSVAVFRLDSLHAPDGNDIYSYLWLSSDLKGTIESPGYYFNTKGPEAELAMDNLMLTHGWRRFQWPEVLNNQPPAFRYLPEYKGPIVTAKITNTRTGTPSAGVPAYLSIPGTQLQFYATNSDPWGNAVFHSKAFYGPNELIAQTQALKDSSYKIEVINPFSDQYGAPPVQHIRYTPEWQPALVRQSVNTQVQNTFAVKEMERFALPVLDSMAFYGPPSKRYLLDDYTRFTTMEEVLREFVTEVGVRKRGNQFQLPVIQEAARGYFQGAPLVLLDGVPVFDNNLIMGYDPLKVRKIEVVAHRYFYGPFTYDGIINFTTYNGTLDGFSLDPRALVVDYEGLQLQREFFMPQYDDPMQVESRKPDFRSVVYWNPEVQTGTDGKTQVSFFTSDVTGTYIAVIQGLEANGACGSGYLQFMVK